jgi:Cu(I)/Ag(I) efflux system membrane fusion protein
MSKLFLIKSLLLVLTIGVTLPGCSNQQSNPQPSALPETTQDQSAAKGHEGHVGHAEHADHVEPSKYADGLSQLSAEDRKLAEKQKVCPVSGQPLGSMGEPYKVAANGQDVFLCCQGCENKIKEDPEKYLAKPSP